MQLLEDRDKQSELDDWMEYQDYELRTYERLEKDLEGTQERLESRRKILAEAGIPAFEGIQELEFASYYSLALKCSGEEGKAKNEEELAERKLRLAEKRLKAAESDDLGERVERDIWVGLFLKDVESAQVRLDELQRLVEDAERELAPSWWWVKAKLNEPYKRREDITEAETAEFEDQLKKRDGFQKKASEVGWTHDRVKEELEFAEEGYKAAQLDDIRETVERAALTKVTQAEVRSAHTQFEQARKSTEKIKLKRLIASGLGSISDTKRKMKRHNVLLEWIEQQRREIASGRADTKEESSQGRSKRASSRAFRNRPATEASRTNKPPKASGRKRKQSTTRSILSPVDPAKVSKAPSKRRSPRQQMSVPCDTSQTAEKTTTDSSNPESRSKQAMPASLRPIHSSRVSKPRGKRPTRQRRDGTKLPITTGAHRLKREYNSGPSSTPSTGRKAMQQSADASLRRSTRTSKPPERFHPGFA